MTETSPASRARRLERPADRRMVAGVCAGLGDYTDIDPVVYRVVLAVLTVAGGLGLLLYGLGWVLMPRSDDDRSVAERVLHAAPGRLSAAPMVALITAIVVLLSPADHRGSTAIAVAVVLVVAYAVHQRRGEPATAAAVATPVPPTDATAYVPPPPAPRARRRRERSPLGLLTVSAALLVAGLLTAAGSSGSTDLTPPRIVAAALVVLGLGLVVGAWFGRARWLLALGAVTALALGPVAVADAGARDGTGTRTWVPVAADASYRLGVGDAVLDLTRLGGAGPVRIAARVGVGHLEVVLPEGFDVRVVAHAGVGGVSFPGDSRGGIGVDRTLRGQPEGAGGVVTVSVGIGDLEVRYA